MVRNQLTQQEARALFEYRDGMLYWRGQGSGRRSDLRALMSGDQRGRIKIGGQWFLGRYVCWNWHYGPALSRIEPIDGDAMNISIDNLEARGEFMHPALSPARATCPCCSQPVVAPTPDIVAMNCGLTPMQQRILRAVWNAAGMAVPTGRIYDVMYEDDPGGGPGFEKMRKALKECISKMRPKLKGSGYGVVNDGPGAGYRLVMGKVE